MVKCREVLMGYNAVHLSDAYPSKSHGCRRDCFFMNGCRLAFGLGIFQKDPFDTQKSWRKKIAS